jgi:hypothetical protein
LPDERNVASTLAAARPTGFSPAEGDIRRKAAIKRTRVKWARTRAGVASDPGPSLTSPLHLSARKKVRSYLTIVIAAGRKFAPRRPALIDTRPNVMLRRDCASSAVGAFLEISGSEPATSDAFQFFVSVTHLHAPSSNVWNGRGRPHSHVGSSAMPRATPRNFAFEVEHIQSMHRAFEAVCARLELSTGTGDRLTELVASRIIELAMAGEWNAERLTARTLAELGIGNDGSLWRH